MNIVDIITDKQIIVNLKAQNKRALLESLAEVASEQTSIEKRIIFDALLERESLGSTGFGNKVAVPHARIAGLNDVFSLLVILDNPIDFDSVDGANVDLMFLLLSPENNGADHLTALASVSRILKDEIICDKLRSTKDITSLCAILKNLDQAC